MLDHDSIDARLDARTSSLPAAVRRETTAPMRQSRSICP
jgi:hypothetical protein